MKKNKINIFLIILEFIILAFCLRFMMDAIKPNHFVEFFCFYCVFIIYYNFCLTSIKNLRREKKNGKK